MSSRKSMNLRFYIHSKSKRAEALALIDLGATKNFMNLKYAKYLQLPIKRLEEPQSLFNVDGTMNKSGSLQYYTDLQVQTGSQRTNLRFFLTDLGKNKAILGYPWFAAVQLRINWKNGWVDHSQLPIILRSPDAAKARFIPRQINHPTTHQTDRYFIGRIMIDPIEQSTPSKLDKIPEQYRQYSRVFRRSVTRISPVMYLGPRHRAQTRSSCIITWKTHTTVTTRTRRATQICQRTPRQRHHLTVQVSVYSVILLYQKERWQTTTCPRLSPN